MEYEYNDYVGASKAKPRKKPKDPSREKAGRWTDAERRAFLVGLQRFGRGKWKEIATMIPTRSTVQVKTHAQMVMKRVAAGDEAFAEYYLDLLASPSLQIGETTTMLVKEKESFHSKSGTTRRNKVVVSEIYDEHGLSQKDQQAAHILYQMAH